MEHSEERSKANFWRSRAGITLIVFGAFAALLLILEHRAHALGALPWLILLACPLMHVFMHRGHGGHGGHGGHNAPLSPPAADGAVPSRAADRREDGSAR
jgi:hypothetical protein